MLFFAYFGVTFLALLGALSAHSTSHLYDDHQKCPQSEVIQRIQDTCYQENEGLLQAEQEGITKQICEKYIAMLYCVAEKEAECFDVYEPMSTMYQHSPHNCPITSEQVLHIQSLADKHKQSQVDDGESNPNSGETTPDSAPEPWTDGQSGGTGVNEYNIHTDPQKDKLGNKGQREEHKGSDGQKDHAGQLSAWSVFILLGLTALALRLP